VPQLDHFSEFLAGVLHAIFLMEGNNIHLLE